VREITVHLGNQGGILPQGTQEAVLIGASQTVFVRAMEYLHLPRIGSCELVRDLAGSVGGVVIYDDHAQVKREREQRLCHIDEVIGFIVGGEDNDDPGLG
jgi:hypothetical protein